MLNQLYKYRFETFLTSQLFILFGSLFFPQDFYEHTLLPILYLTSIAAGILMISKWKKLMWLFVGLFVITALIFSSDAILKFQNTKTLLIRLSIYFIFYFFLLGI